MMKSSSGLKEHTSLFFSYQTRIKPQSPLRKLLCSFFLLLSFIFFFYSLYFLNSSNINNSLCNTNNSYKLSLFNKTAVGNQVLPEKTSFHHVAFGIAASAKLWDHRKNYIKLWWDSSKMRGFVWLDRLMNINLEEDDAVLLPPVRVSADTSRFSYTNPNGHRSAIRISRILSEMVVMPEMEEVRWFVMGDDDTFFVAENLLRVLGKYNHEQFYYIGSSSESHVQNIYFSYAMAYGGGGFAISAPLARSLAKMQDRCIQRYPSLYGSDDRIQACMAELGVPLTKEPGFHQFDVYGSVLGLLMAHPVAPLVTLHHLDLVQPIFPGGTQVDALQHLKQPIALDSAGLAQQSICYDQIRNWTILISWGYTVQIIRGAIPVREMETPARTFINWYRNSDAFGFSFNTRLFIKSACQMPFIFFFENATYDEKTNLITSHHVRHHVYNPKCSWKIASPWQFKLARVYKQPDPYLWDKAPRRNCCRVLPTKRNNTLEIDVGFCEEDELGSMLDHLERVNFKAFQKSTTLQHVCSKVSQLQF